MDIFILDQRNSTSFLQEKLVLISILDALFLRSLYSLSLDPIQNRPCGLFLITNTTIRLLLSHPHPSQVYWLKQQLQHVTQYLPINSNDSNDIQYNKTNTGNKNDITNSNKQSCLNENDFNINSFFPLLDEQNNLILSTQSRCISLDDILITIIEYITILRNKPMLTSALDPSFSNLNTIDYAPNTSSFTLQPNLSINIKLISTKLYYNLYQESNVRNTLKNNILSAFPAILDQDSQLPFKYFHILRQNGCYLSFYQVVTINENSIVSHNLFENAIRQVETNKTFSVSELPLVDDNETHNISVNMKNLVSFKIF